MKEIAEIRADLKCIRWHYPKTGDFKPPQWYWNKDFNELDSLKQAYENALTHAPKILSAVYNEMYRKGRTQKAVALEKNVTEKYIQILHKRLILFFQKTLD